jgi:hypothetical protein
MNKISSFISMSFSIFLLACGGGGNVNDGQTPLRTTPAEITLQSTLDFCPPAANGTIIYIFGGSAPYSLRNPVPDALQLSTNTISGAGDGFKIDFKGGCLETIPVIVVDSNGATTEVKVSYKAKPPAGI